MFCASLLTLSKAKSLKGWRLWQVEGLLVLHLLKSFNPFQQQFR